MRREQALRDWSDPEIGGIDLDDMASVEENLQDLRDTYAPFEDGEEDEDELNLENFSDEELDSKLDELYELANTLADEAGDDPTDEQIQQYDEYVAYINAFEAELNRRKGETDDSDEETDEETDESDETDEETDEIPPDETETDENQGKPLVVGKGNRLPDDLAEWYMGLDVDFEDYSDEELAEIGWNASKELTDMLNGAKPVPPSEVENTNVPPELRQRYEDLYHTAKTASNILTERKNRAETPEIPEKTDENEVETPEIPEKTEPEEPVKRKLPQTYDELIQVLNGKKEGSLKLGELDDRDLDILRNNYLKEFDKLPRENELTRVVWDEEGEGDDALDEKERKKQRKWHSEVTDPENYEKFTKLNRQFDKVKKELARRGRLKAQQEKAEADAETERRRAEGGRQESYDTGDSKPKRTRSTKKNPNLVHTSPFVLEGVQEPFDARWSNLKDKDSTEVAQAALGFDPLGEGKPIIGSGKPVESNDIPSTIGMMKEASMGLRKYLVQLARLAGDKELEDESYASQNPWETAGKFVSKYSESSPETVHDLRNRMYDSYEAIRAEFERETDPKTNAHNETEAERKARLKNTRDRPVKPKSATEQRRVIKTTYGKAYNNIQEAYQGYRKALARLSKDDTSKNSDITALNSTYTDITTALDDLFADREMSFDDKIQAMQDLEEDGLERLKKFTKSCISLGDIDFSELPNWLQKAFRSEFNHMRVLLAGYACMYPNIVPGHTVESTVDIMLRHPETLEKSHREYAEDNLSLFHDRVETMLYEYLTTLQN